MKKEKNIIKNKIDLKFYKILWKKKKNFLIKTGDYITCKYWLTDKYKYRILWFGGLCISLKKKKHLSYIILKNNVWNVKILQYFFIFSPSFLNFVWVKKPQLKVSRRLYYL